MERQAVKIVRPARKGKAPLRRRLGGLLFSLFRFCVLFGLIFLIVYPFLFMFVTAFRGSEDLNDPSVVWITRHYTLNNFHNFLQMVDFGDMMGNTVVISLSSAVLQTFVCGLAGYGFARFRFRGRNLLFGLLLLGQHIFSAMFNVELQRVYQKLILGFINIFIQIGQYLVNLGLLRFFHIESERHFPNR